MCLYQCQRHGYLNPLDSLKLRINDERPSLSVHQYGCILSRHPVAWKSLVVPLSNLCIICQQRQGVQTFREWNCRHYISQKRNPVFLHEFQPIWLGEVADVWDEGCGKQNVAGKGLSLTLVVFNGFCPSYVLRSQTTHQPIGEHNCLVCRLSLSLTYKKTKTSRNYYSHNQPIVTEYRPAAFSIHGDYSKCNSRCHFKVKRPRSTKLTNPQVQNAPYN